MFSLYRRKGIICCFNLCRKCQLFMGFCWYFSVISFLPNQFILLSLRYMLSCTWIAIQPLSNMLRMVKFRKSSNFPFLASKTLQRIALAPMTDSQQKGIKYCLVLRLFNSFPYHCITLNNILFSSQTHYRGKQCM